VVAVVERIRERKPGTRIVIQSLLPTDDDTKNRDLVLPVNARLRAYAANAGNVGYLDLYPAFVDDTGAQRRDLFNDSLHPSREGYRVWRDLLVALLQGAKG
jgi:lysophospholipase L1-like esterase